MTTPSQAELIEACRDELEDLWADMDRAVRRAINCTWSMEALNIKGRIQQLTKLVGPTPWECIQITLLESGIYQSVHNEIGIDAPVDMRRAAAARARNDSGRPR